MDLTLRILMHRVEKLERSNARLRSALLLLVGLFGLLAFSAATPGGPMTVRGPSGHRIVINGEYMAFEDSKGTSRLSIGLTSGGESMIDVRDNSGRTRARFGIDTSGNAKLETVGPNGSDTMYFGEFTDKSYGFSVYDKSGLERAYMGMSSLNNPQFSLHDASKTQRLFIGHFTDGSYGEALYDAAGTRLWGEP